MQVKGKVRAHIEVATDAEPAAIEAAALADPAVVKAIDGRPVQRVVVVPGSHGERGDLTGTVDDPSGL